MHMTLGRFMTNYLYIPLGGNRKGEVKTLRNLFIVFLASGIWHGAGYNFVLWGVIISLIIIIEKLYIGKFLERFPAAGHIYMLVLIPLTWAVFAIDNMGQLGVFFTRLFPFFGQGVWSIFRYDYIKYLKLYWPFLAAGLLFSTHLPFNILKLIKNRFVIAGILAVIFIASVYCMYRGLDDPFLYFRF